MLLSLEAAAEGSCREAEHEMLPFGLGLELLIIFALACDYFPLDLSIVLAMSIVVFCNTTTMDISPPPLCLLKVVVVPLIIDA